jgi:pyruvate/2-oxoglutarate dehydrogenase complex dihydrolipoamide dehydrogenase (E3) component
MFDYVKPSTQGTKWGLGGTCVNVGCVPKKLMHYASLMSPVLHQDAAAFGWKVPEHVEHDWSKLVSTVQNHVKSLNFGYRTGLRSANVTYINALAKFKSPHEIAYTLKDEEKVITGKYILIAVGGRPHIPSDVAGAREYAITSDDIFSLKRSPGKSLVVGASYIALECAGFLTKLGFPTTVAVRSILLRGFDRQCAEKIGQMMEAFGTRFYRGSLPTSLVKQDDGRILVTFSGDREPEVSSAALFITDAHLFQLHAEHRILTWDCGL